MTTTHTCATTIAAIRYAGIRLGMGPFDLRHQVWLFENGMKVYPEVAELLDALLAEPDVPAWEDAYRDWVGERA